MAASCGRTASSTPWPTARSSASGAGCPSASDAGCAVSGPCSGGRPRLVGGRFPGAAAVRSVPRVPGGTRWCPRRTARARPTLPGHRRERGRREEADQLCPSHGAPLRRRIPDDGVVDLGERDPVRVDHVAADLGASADREAQRPQPGPPQPAASVRATPPPRSSAGTPRREPAVDPHVVGDQHTAGARRRWHRPWGGARWTGVGGQGAERTAPHLGQRALRPVEEARDAELVRRPAGEAVPGGEHRLPARERSRRPEGTNGTTSTAPKRGDAPHGGWPRSMCGDGGAATRRAAASTSARSPPRVRTDRWWSGRSGRRGEVPPAAATAATTSRSRPSLMLMTHSAPVTRRRRHRGSGADADDAQADPAAAEDAPALALRLAAPHAVVDALVQRVLEACSATGHSAQMRWASCTPTPSLGKKMDGDSPCTSLAPSSPCP